MHNNRLKSALICSVLGSSLVLTSPGSAGAPATSAPVYLDQGSNWTAATRADFYSRDQGAQMIPLAWLKALTTADGQPFLADSFARYGYLPNPDSDVGLPVGFTASGPAGSEITGMTCAACHTRQITVAGRDYRVDGGPALVDFQALLADLSAAVGRVLLTDASFKTFATAVLGPGASPAEVASLKQAVQLWYLREGTMTDRALPKTNPWGLGRLDAVSMIFNRLTGLDLGAAPSYMIPGNIRTADAPVRYPFLWNAPIQDKTQWPGFADNGNDILGLARNLGEVYGVYGVYRPKKEWWHIGGINFLSDNSANFDGLNRLEGLVKKIGAPKWPWAIDQTLAQRGSVVFSAPAPGGSCASCHGQKPGVTRFLLQKTWATPIVDVGTDSRQYAILGRDADSGVLTGASIPFLMKPILPKQSAFSLLGFSVVGSIVQNYTTLSVPKLATAQGVAASPPATGLSAAQADLKGAFNLSAAIPATTQYAYESRVLYGIWAAAPYLHNGSVASLADLLQPAAKRAVTFNLGRYYDPDTVGLAADQHGSTYTRTTTDCADRNSGNSRCGHEFGTTLPDADKRALLEYMKTL
jgi:hypothetical protein